MKINKLLIGALALSLTLSACGGGGTQTKESKTTSPASEQMSQSDAETSDEAGGASEEETDGEFITEEDWNNNESIFNSGSRKAVLADETKAILDGMKTFESDALYTWENPQDGGMGPYGELGNPFYYETWALAETFVRAEHEKSYDLLQLYKAKVNERGGRDTEEDFVFPIVSTKEDYVQAMNLFNSENLYEKYPDLIIAKEKTLQHNFNVYESEDKAKADPENPLLVIELNTYNDEGAYIFPSYKNALRYTVSYQFLPEDKDKFGTEKGIGFGTPMAYYLNDEEAGSVEGFIKSKESRRVYPGTYQFKLDGHENSEYKIGKPNASGHEFSGLVADQDAAFTGKVIIGLGDGQPGDLVLYGYPDKDNYPHGMANNIVIMQGLIGASDSVLSLETVNALTNPNKE
jgi:hypothetical protein